jgi:3-oxoacyl-[acyl-carrier protein] reductase
MKLDRRTAIAPEPGRGIGQANTNEVDPGPADQSVELIRAQDGAMTLGIPLGRAGTPEEAASAVYPFCIPESDYTTGQVVVAGGGLVI